MNSRQVRSFHDDKLELSCRIGAFTLRVVLFWTWSLHRFGGVLILSTCETWTILNLATVLVCPNIGPPKSCPKKNYPGTKRYIFRWLFFHCHVGFRWYNLGISRYFNNQKLLTFHIVLRKKLGIFVAQTTIMAPDETRGAQISLKFSAGLNRFVFQPQKTWVSSSPLQ